MTFVTLHVPTYNVMELAVLLRMKKFHLNGPLDIIWKMDIC